VAHRTCGVGPVLNWPDDQDPWRGRPRHWRRDLRSQLGRSALATKAD